ncbi:MAG: Arc family DNA-binding protein [Actinomycetota bacterium]
MARDRKQFPLRIPPELYDVYEGWAADEFRSVNAQIEAVLVDAARRAGRLRRPPATGRTTGEEPGDAPS